MSRKIFTKSSSKRKDSIHDICEEESADESFASASTDENATDYQLDLTGHTLSAARISERAKQGTSSPKSTSEIRKYTKRPVQGSKYSQKSLRFRKGNQVSRSENTETSRRQEDSSSSGSEPAQQITRSRSQTTAVPMEQRISRTHREDDPPGRTRESNANVTSYASPRRNQPENTQSRHRRKGAPKRRNLLQDIMHLRSTVHLLIPRLPFSRLVREITYTFKNDARYTLEAMTCLQEATEIYLVNLLEDSYMCTLHRMRKTLIVKDMELVRYLRGRCGQGHM